MTIPIQAGPGMPFDVVYDVNGERMGFITLKPADARRVSDFAPPVRLGNDPAYAEGAYSTWSIPGFAHGGDSFRFTADSQQYWWADGGVFLGRPNFMTLASQWEAVDASQVATAKQIVDFSNGATFDYICVGVGTKLRIYDDALSTWASEQPSGGPFAANAIWLYSSNTYLFVACGSGADFWRWDGTKGTGWAQPAAGEKANGFTWWLQKLVLWYGNGFKIATNNNGSAWSAATPVGLDSTNILCVWPAAGLLVIGKPEGLYSYDGTTVEQLLGVDALRSVVNFRLGVEYQGFTYTSILNSVRKGAIVSASQANWTDSTPRMEGDADKELHGHGLPVWAVVGPNLLYVGFDDGEGVYPEVLGYNEIGWHQVYRGTAGATLAALGYSRIKGWLLVNDGSTRRKRLQNLSDAEYPDYAASGQLITAWYDAGMPDSVKSFRDVALWTDGASEDETVTVEYEADESGVWVDMGDVIADPVTSLSFGGLSAQKGARKLRLRLTLARGEDASLTPTIRFPILVRVRPTLESQHALTDVLILDTDHALRHDYGLVSDAYTLDQMLDFLDMLEDTPHTVTRTDEFGRQRLVQNADLALSINQRDKAGRESTTCSLTFLEVYAGLSRQASERVAVSEVVTGALRDVGAAHGWGSRSWGFDVWGT